MTSEQIIDKASAIERIGDEDIYEAVVEIFLEDTPQQLALLDEALEGEDFVTAERQAHSMKSAAANIGATVFSNRAKELEHKVGKSSLEELINLAQQLKEDMDKIVEHLSG